MSVHSNSPVDASVRRTLAARGELAELLDPSEATLCEANERLAEVSSTLGVAPTIVAVADALDEASRALTLPVQSTVSVRDPLSPLLDAACAIRDAHWGPDVTYSPKAFFPVTNLCRNRCDYCTFRRSPTDDGVWTMRPDELESGFAKAKAEGCIEALLCLGDTPETAFASYRRTLAEFGHDSTAEYLRWAGERALAAGLLPHTNAGILTAPEMRLLRPVNVSMGLMLENISHRLCERGMPHFRAPDKRPARRVAMIREAGTLKIPFTSGLLIGIGETWVERVRTVLALAVLQDECGHLQEIIVQNFRAKPTIPMANAREPEAREMMATVALARCIMQPDVSVQAPPNLNPATVPLLVASGINDLGGISPVTPDYVNPGHPWPHLEALADNLAAHGRTLARRLPIYGRYLHERDGWLDPALFAPTLAASRRHEIQLPASCSLVST